MKTGRVIVSAVLLSASLSALVYSAPSQMAVEAYNKGVKLFNAGQFNEAIPYFDKAIDRSSDFPDAYYARAVCKRELNSNSAAISDLNQTIQLKPDLVDAYALRGSIWYEQEQWDHALQDFDYVLKRQPQNAQALLGRGLIRLRKEQIGSAKRDLRLFVKLNPNDPVSPKLRELLASLSRESEEVPEPNSETYSQAPGTRPLSPQSEDLLKNLLSSHQIADAYQKKVMRGEQTQAVGDIRQQGVQIVDPK